MIGERKNNSYHEWECDKLILILEEYDAERNLIIFDAGLLESCNEVFDRAGISEAKFLLDLFIDTALRQVVYR